MSTCHKILTQCKVLTTTMVTLGIQHIIQHENRVFGSNFQLDTTNLAPQGSSSIYNNRSSGYVSNSNSNESKLRLSYFNFKSDFQSFWTIFQIGMRKFNWNRDKQIEQLLCSLKDDALTFVAKIPASVQGGIHTLYAALKQRYGDYLLH